MSFSHEIVSTRVHTERSRQARPSFSSYATSDRLREGDRPSAVAVPKSKIKPQRRSVFREIGLDDVNRSPTPHSDESKTPTIVDKEEAKGEPKITFEHTSKDVEPKDTVVKRSLLSKFKGSRPDIKTAASTRPGLFPTVPRVALIVLLICVVVPGFRYGGGARLAVRMGE